MRPQRFALTELTEGFYHVCSQCNQWIGQSSTLKLCGRLDQHCITL
jgi:hypothetical protein